MKITKGRLKQIIQEELSRVEEEYEYVEREVTQDFTNPDEVRAIRFGWYELGQSDGTNALKSGTNQLGEQYSSSRRGGWNVKHGDLPVEYMDGYNNTSGGKAKEHYDEKVLQNRDDMLAQKAIPEIAELWGGFMDLMGIPETTAAADPVAELFHKIMDEMKQLEQGRPSNEYIKKIHDYLDDLSDKLDDPTNGYETYVEGKSVQDWLTIFNKWLGDESKRKSDRISQYGV